MRLESLRGQQAAHCLHRSDPLASTSIRLPYRPRPCRPWPYRPRPYHPRPYHPLLRGHVHSRQVHPHLLRPPPVSRSHQRTVFLNHQASQRTPTHRRQQVTSRAQGQCRQHILYRVRKPFPLILGRHLERHSQSI